MSSYQWGGYRVIHLVDGTEDIPFDACVHPEGREARDRALRAVIGPTVRVVVNFYLLKGDNGITLIDAGTGPGAKPELGHGRAALQTAGVRPEEVDRVLLTHVHFDHARGLLDGDRAWLPRAEIHVAQADVAHFTNATIRDSLPPLRQRSFRAAEGIVEAYRGRIQSLAPGSVLPGIEAIAMPGHTPGQTGFLLTGTDGDILFSADLFHLREAEVKDPDLCLVYDNDPVQTSATRRALYARAVDEAWLLAPTHVEGLVRVAREDGGFKLLDA